MADFVRVAQFPGEALDPAQHTTPQSAHTGFQREGGAQGVRYPSLHTRMAQRSSGIVALAGGGFAFLCPTHGEGSSIVSDPLDVKAGCGQCEAEADALRGGAKRRFLEVLSHG